MTIGFSGVPFSGEDVGAVEGRAQRIDIVQAVGLVQAGVDQDDVAGLRFALVDLVPVAEAGAVVRGLQAGEGGLLLLALPSRRDRRAACGRRRRLSARRAFALWRSGRPVPSRRPDPSWSAGLRIRCRDRGRGCCRRNDRARCNRDAPLRGRPARRPSAEAAAPASTRPRRRAGSETSTVALRLSSPVMSHSKPRQISVGGSTTKCPACTPLPASSTAEKALIRRQGAIQLLMVFVR